MIREDRAGLESEFALSVFLVIDFGAGHVGRQEVRRELNAAKVRFQVLCKSLDRTRFRSPGKPSTNRFPLARSPMMIRSTTVS